ncbi:MAG: isochorismatase family protein, partial [Candidatus Bathyarchaeia archaeon]
MKYKISGKEDALIIVDVQIDFCPGGALPVPEGDKIIPVLNEYIRRFDAAGALIVATRVWHPPNHISFRDYGGLWPPHCVQGTKGAEFHPELRLPNRTLI